MLPVITTCTWIVSHEIFILFIFILFGSVTYDSFFLMDGLSVSTLLNPKSSLDENKVCRHSPFIEYKEAKFPVDFETRFGLDYMSVPYEPKVIKSGLPEMLLHFMSHLVMKEQEEKREDYTSFCAPRRLLYYREGQEYSLVDEKKQQQNYFGDLVTILSPGIYTFTHQNRRVFLNIASEGCTLLKEFFFIQLAWERQPDDSKRFIDLETLSSLLNDAKTFYPYNLIQDAQHLTVFRYSASTMWEMTKRIPQRDLATIHLPAAFKESIVSEIQHFFDQQQELKNKNLPRKLVFLFCAERGRGKTEFIHALLTHFKMHKGVLSPEEIDNDLVCVHALPNRTAICFENIDEMEGEESSTLENFQSLLDGRDCDRPLLIFLTSRKSESDFPEHVRKALLTGRIDRIESLKAPRKDEVQEMFLRFYPEQKKEFKNFWKQVRKMDLPNLSILENFFRKYLDGNQMTSPTGLTYLQNLIRAHKKNTISVATEHNMVM